MSGNTLSTGHLVQGKSRTVWCRAHYIGPRGVSRNRQNLKLETQAEAAHQNRGRWIVWEVGCPDLPLDRCSLCLLAWFVCASDCVDQAAITPQLPSPSLSSFCSAISLFFFLLFPFMSMSYPQLFLFSLFRFSKTEFISLLSINHPNLNFSGDPFLSSRPRFQLFVKQFHLSPDKHLRYWSELPFPLPGDLLYPGIELVSLTTPALASRFFTTRATWEAPNLADETSNSSLCTLKFAVSYVFY